MTAFLDNSRGDSASRGDYWAIVPSPSATSKVGPGGWGPGQVDARQESSGGQAYTEVTIGPLSPGSQPHPRLVVVCWRSAREDDAPEGPGDQGVCSKGLG